MVLGYNLLPLANIFNSNKSWYLSDNPWKRYHQSQVRGLLIKSWLEPFLRNMESYKLNFLMFSWLKKLCIFFKKENG